MQKVIENYITYLREIKQSSENTIASYYSDLEQLVSYLQLHQITSFEQMTETTMNSYFLGLEKEGLSPASVTRKMVTVRTFVLYCIKNGYMRKDPMERIKAPKVRRKELVYITMKEMEALLLMPDTTKKKGVRDKAMLEVLYATGMKVSELLALKIEDVNLKLRYILVGGMTKERLLPFGSECANALVAHIKMNKESMSESSYLFGNQENVVMTRQGFLKVLRVYTKKAGIEVQVTPQVIRNSFAMHMLDNGADLQSIQELLGHADMVTTQYLMKKNDRKTREIYTKTHPRA